MQVKGTRFLLTRFTNPHGERVSQVFCNGITLTRENPDEQTARDYAWDSYSRHEGSATLSEWDGDAGTPDQTILAQKIGGRS